MEKMIIYALLAIIVILIVVCFKLSSKIKYLYATLQDERKKRTLPILTLEKDDDKRMVDIINESYCYAQNIVVTQTALKVDYGFPVKLILKFDVIERLKPNERVTLNYRVLNNEADVTDSNSKHALYLYPDESLDISIMFENLEGAKFTSKVGYKDNMFFVKELSS